MAYFAKIENGIVTQIIVISNDKCPGNFPESESLGVSFCNSIFTGEWKQTSYNNSFRKRYAGVGYEYNSEHDVFISPKPFDSWVLNVNDFIYESTIEAPNDGKNYYWDEETISWIEII